MTDNQTAQIRSAHDDLKREAFEIMDGIPEEGKGPDAILTNTNLRTSADAGPSLRESLDLDGPRKPSNAGMSTLLAGAPASPSRRSGDTTGTDKASSTGSTDKDSSQSAKRNQIKRLRWKAWIFLIVTECVLGLLAMGQILSFRSFVLDVATTNSQTELHFLKLQFQDTFLRNLLGLETLAELPETGFVLKHGLHANTNATLQVQTWFQEQTVIRKLHFLTLVNYDGTILMGSNKNRSGEYWDPAGVVSTLKTTRAPYVKTTANLTLQELAKEESPEYFDGILSYKAKQHMNRAGTDGLVQYIGVPVSESGSVVGYLVGGHIISGDTNLLENSVSLFGSGFGVILFSDTNGKPVQAIEILIKEGLHYFQDGVSTSVQQEMISKAYDDSGVHTRFLTIRGVDHVVAYQRAPNTQIGSGNFTSSKTPAICVVGHPLDSVNNVLQEVISITLTFTTACLIVDVIGTMVSIRLFIDPLERLHNYVKLKVYKKYESLLKEISLNQRYMLRVLLFSLLSVVFLILMITHNSQSLTEVFHVESQASVELSLSEYAYSLDPIVNSIGQTIFVDDEIFREYLDHPSDPTLLSKVTAELIDEMNIEKLEFATLVGNDSRILVGANANRTGEFFDPSGIVTDVLNNARRIIVTTTMTNAEFRLEGAKRWLKPNTRTDLEGTLQSKLHPYENNNTVLVRWAATPMYATSNTNKSKPDGVLLYGDIINGKISYNELIVSEFNDGYAATFFFDTSSSQFVLLSAVRLEGDRLIIDEFIPEAEQALKTAQSTKTSALVEGTYLGEPFEMAAESFETSVFYSCADEQVPLLESAFNPPLYQVRATSNAHWVALRQKQLAIQVVTVVVQVLSSALISWVLFLPVYRFVQVIQQEFGLSKANKYKNESKGTAFKAVLSKFGVKDSTRASQAKDSQSAVSNVA